jgi:pimeloyl-ACP methyl ester carboxylesterase
LIERFKIAVDQTVLDDLHTRLARTRLPVSPEDRAWEDGTDLHYLAALIAYWRDRFDWRAQEEALNAFNHFMADVGPTRVHFLHERGAGPAPIPLLLIHGWPDGFWRFLKLIPLLTNPSAHGGDAADAFDVIVPSLPGYGFSPRPAVGADRLDFAPLFDTLMTDVLGYRRYGAQGGDVGAGVCDQLYREHGDNLIGVHLTNMPMSYLQQLPAELSQEDQDFVAEMQRFRLLGGGYMHLQGTKPWTPAVGLNDSPAGLAAWIVEKMHAWSDCQGYIERSYTKDELITNIMIYWITQSIGTSFLSYRDGTKPKPRQATTDQSSGARPPVGFAIFPKEIANPSRQLAERFFNVQHWTKMDRGGHFAAFEEPEKMAQDLRNFFRPLRT